ncbi:histidine phosphatase family protein [Leptospira fletcheri]|uniref:Histidine phosphatase family protein n=1 Tax=Leptospira fletcheri TaxID=2484981 RepID=A0A4V3JDY6_9LEPT|nr:histidine phosphatase family protein [Leptospira fletcheri]
MLSVFRHGETDWNALSKLQGQLDVPLSVRGKQQVGILSEALLADEIESVYSSDLSRAKETVLPLAERFGIPILFDPRLREVHLGEAQGIHIADIDSRFGAHSWSKWKSFDPLWDGFSFPNGETKPELDGRIFSFLKSILQTPDQVRVGICTHGYWISRMLFLLNLQPKEDLRNCEVFRIRLDAKSFFAKTVP